MKNPINHQRVKDLSNRDITNVQLAHKVLKVGEEAGELQAEFLSFMKASNASKSAEGTKMAVLEECCDVINVVLDLVNVLGVSDKEFKEAFEKKLDKWESKIV